MSEVGVILCGCCNLIVTDECKAIMCDGDCGLWFHSSCVSISDAKMKKITDLGEIVLWMCVSDRAKLEGWRSSSAGLGQSSVALESANILKCIADLASSLSQIETMLRASSLTGYQGEASGNADASNLPAFTVAEPKDKPTNALASDSSGSFSRVINNKEIGIAMASNHHISPESSNSAPRDVIRTRNRVTANQFKRGIISTKLNLTNINTIDVNVHGVTHTAIQPEHIINNDVHTTDLSMQEVSPELRLNIIEQQPTINNGSATGATYSAGSSASSDVILQTVPNIHRKYLYVSRLHPNTSWESVLKYISGKLSDYDTSGVQCFSLAPKHAIAVDAKTLSFVSFKIGVPTDLHDAVDIIGAKNFWPSGIVVREFTNYRQPKNGKRSGALTQQD